MVKNLLLAAVVSMTALPAAAQTAAEQLQRAIFTQNSQGNLDAAIAIYRQLSYSGLTPRDVAAEAQYRLGQALLAKGDVPTATREFERLERDFADYQKLISSLSAKQERVPTALFLRYQDPATTGPLVQSLLVEASHSRFDGPPSVTLQGNVTQVVWVNPRSYMYVDAGSQKYAVQLTSPLALTQQGGTRQTFTAGQEVVIQAIRPNQGRFVANDTEVVQAGVITSMDGKVLFDWSKVPEATRAPVEPVK